MSLFVSVPYQLTAYGSRADHPVPLGTSIGCGQIYGQQTIWPDPQGVPTLTVQPEFGASLSQLFFTGSLPPFLRSINIGYYSRSVILESP